MIRALSPVPRFGTIYKLIPNDSLSQQTLNKRLATHHNQTTNQLIGLMKSQDEELGVYWDNHLPMILESGSDIFGFTAHHSSEVQNIFGQHPSRTTGDLTEMEPDHGGDILNQINDLLERNPQSTYELYFNLQMRTYH